MRKTLVATQLLEHKYKLRNEKGQNYCLETMVEIFCPNLTLLKLISNKSPEIWKLVTYPSKKCNNPAIKASKYQFYVTLILLYSH